MQIDFWDAEDGYYQNSTYYGDKNLLAIAGANRGAGRQDRHDCRFPDGEKGAQWRCVHD